MDAASIVVVLAAVGVNFGWQPAEDGPDGYEYVVQLEPELLEVLKRGEKVPVESNVPPEVAPIRKVSIMVGRGDLPRESLGPVNRTAYFAGQPEWTPDRYSGVAQAAATTADDRYGQPPAFDNQSAVAPPPSVVDRAQAAVTETADTLRDGVEAGIQAANEQLYRNGEQLRDSATSAGQQFGQRFQELASDPQRQLETVGNNLRGSAQQTLSTVGNQLQQVTNPFASPAAQPAANRRQGSVAPPPWSQAGSTTAPPWSDDSETSRQPAASQTAPPSAFAPSRTPSGWTSINPNMAGPAMVMPQLATAPRTNTATAAAGTSNDGGPSFPNSTSISRQPIHSVLTDPSSGATQSPPDDWSSGWDNAAGATQATIGRTASGDATTQSNQTRGSELVPVQPLDTPRQRYQPPQQSQQATNGWGDSWAEGDLWSRPPQSSPTNTTITAQSPPAARASAQSNQASVAQDSNVSANPAANRAVDSAIPATAKGEEPWLPLLVVSLSLMGSLGANLFLGWSYMDARQKYRSLVQKTANAFRRTKPAAA